MTTAQWLPVSVALRNGRPAITCLDVGNAAFAEPFFRDTIAAERRARGSAEIVVSIEELRAAIEPPVEPAGFIFHMSRCGSTLISQLLKEIAGVRVYAEPPAVNQALTLAPQLPRDVLLNLVDVIVRTFCLHRPDGPGRVLFKFSSWNVLHYSLFVQLFPGVPTLLVVRRPAEVLASIAKAAPGFVSDRETFAEAVRHRAGDRTDALDDVEFAAAFLGIFLDAMASALKSGGEMTSIRVLDYSDLPSAAWRTLPAFFGIPEESVDVPRLEALAHFYSKSYPARVPFERERESVAETGRALFERHAATWIESRYDDLIAARGTNIHRGD